MIEQSISPPEAPESGQEHYERLFRAYMAAAKQGMIDKRGYPLRAEERTEIALLFPAEYRLITGQHGPC